MCGSVGCITDIPRRGLEQLLLTEVLVVNILRVVLQILHVRPADRESSSTIAAWSTTLYTYSIHLPMALWTVAVLLYVYD